MNCVLLIINQLTGESEIVNRLFSSVQEAQQYVTENHLILNQIITEQEYQNLMTQYQNQKLLKQLYQRYQQPQQPPQRVLIQDEEEPEEPEQYPRRMIQPGQIVKPRFAIIKKFYPVFAGRKKR